MEKTENKITDIPQHAEQFVETWYKLTLLNITQKSTSIASAGLTAIVVFIASLFVLLLGGIALSLWLGDLVDNRALGFLLGATFFIVVTVIVVALRKRIIFPYFRDLIIRKLYDKV